MLTVPAGSRFTGLHWESGKPVLTALPDDPSSPSRPGRPGIRQDEFRLALPLGGQIGWVLSGYRGCCGIWTGSRRIACPLGSRLGDSTDPQCGTCARADRGKVLARDAIRDDGRRYALYLAWFGPSLLKIGLTAAERGRDRLLEQGAISYTVLAEGSYPGIRQAERAIAATGLAAERIPARAKPAAWWELPAAELRARELATARSQITGHLPWPPGVRETPGPVVDQAAVFGLGPGVPAAWAEVTGVTAGARLVGAVTAIAGRQILLDAAPVPLLVDMRRIAGWPITAAAAPGGTTPAGQLTTVYRTRPKDPDETQSSLF